MGYRRADINLLPPELQPGPVVRYAVVINTILIGVTVAFLIVDSFLSLNRIASLKQEIETKKSLLQSMAGTEADYNELIQIEEHVNSVGRLIALASAEYTDMPVIMDRITRVLPAGVYAESVSSQRKDVGSRSCEVRIALVASRPDPNLLIQAFSAFKTDEVLGDCYMRSAEYKESDLDQVLLAAGVDWTATGADIENLDTADSFRFEMICTVYPPVSAGGLATSVDNTEYFDVFDLEIASTADADPDESGNRVTGAPDGVTAVEAY